MPLRIAICGGGIAGASLLHGLAKYPYLDVHIFEAAPAFKDVGAAIGLSENSLRSLDLMGSSAIDSLYRAGAVGLSDVQIMIGEGPDTNQVVGNIEVKHGRRPHIVHRAAFLRELLADIPPDRMHASKKLVGIHTNSDAQAPVTITFADDTTHACDVLIGADGIHSAVRSHVVGPSDPSTSAVFAGWWVIQCLKPLEQIQPILGEHLMNLQTPREIAWIGRGSYVMHNVLDGGKTAQIAVCFWTGVEGQAAARRASIPVDQIRAIFQHWPSNLRKMIDMALCDQPSQPAFYFWEHLPAHSYVKGTVGIAGDAAHATTPWQASGAAMSIEDAMILSTLLGHVYSSAEAEIALSVYDAVRRSRTQRVVESSNTTGKMFTGVHPSTGVNCNRLKEELLRRWEFIIELDMDSHRDEALTMLRSRIDAARTD